LSIPPVYVSNTVGKVLRGVRCLEAASVILCMSAFVQYSRLITTLGDVRCVDVCDEDDERRDPFAAYIEGNGNDVGTDYTNISTYRTLSHIASSPLHSEHNQANTKQHRGVRGPPPLQLPRCTVHPPSISMGWMRRDAQCLQLFITICACMQRRSLLA
jgi:hypothetical protein